MTVPAQARDALHDARRRCPSPTRFRLRVLASEVRQELHAAKRSPVVGPEQPPAPPASRVAGSTAPDGDCDGDGIKNRVDTDDDNDLLPDTLESRAAALDPCKADTDGDGVEDGYEYQSAKDLNDDEYQTPERVLSLPGQAPVPEPARPPTPTSTTTATR